MKLSRILAALKTVVYFSGRISARDVEAKILDCNRRDLTVFFVGITAGTTVIGAFDPIEEIAHVCHQYKVWLHVDVSYYCLAIL